MIAVFIFMTVVGANAQPGFDDDVQDVPLDGGITILAGIAASLGMRQLNKTNKN